MKSRAGISRSLQITGVVVAIVVVVAGASAYLYLQSSVKNTTSTSLTISSTSSSTTSVTSSSNGLSSSSTTATTTTGPASTNGSSQAPVTLLIYGSVTTSDMQPIIKDFEGNYSYITVNYVELTPPPLYPRVTSEIAAHKPTADLIFVTNVVVYSLENQSLLQSYNSSQLVNYPKAYYDPSGDWADALLLPVVFSYNTQYLNQSQLPANLTALANPEWKGKVEMHDITLGSVGTQYILSLESVLGNQTWTTFLKQFLANVNPTPTSQVSAVSTDVASGKYDLGMVAYLSDIVKLQASGAPIGYFLPSGVPVMIAPESLAIIKGTPHLSAAELFENFILSKPAQTTLGNTQTRPPAMPGISAKYTMQNLLPSSLINSSIIFPTPQVAGEASSWASIFKSWGYS